MNCNERRCSQSAIHGVSLASGAAVAGGLFFPGPPVVGDRQQQMLRGAAAKPTITTEH